MLATRVRLEPTVVRRGRSRLSCLGGPLLSGGRLPVTLPGVADELPRMYTEFADWFHVLSAPEEYAEEAEFYLRTLSEAAGGERPKTVLELGSGGGNNAWHYKRHVEAVSVPAPSPKRLALGPTRAPVGGPHPA